MNKLIYAILIICIYFLPLKAAEKNDCTQYKKLSKKYIACKSGNMKSGIQKKFTGSNNPIKNIIDYQKKAWSKKD